jgi:hypothetical protein
MLFSKASFMLLSIAASANGQVELGTAAAYGVFGGTTIINTGLTIVNARIGLSPGSSITGFLPGINNGQDINNGAATKAKADIQSAYNALAGLPSSSDLTGTDLGGQTLLPGVYTFTSSGGLTGTLTLDGGGASNALFVFQFGSTITTAPDSSVVLVNGAQACNVYWQVGSSANFGTGTDFLGNVLARTSIAVTTGTTLYRGGFYAIDGAVALDTNAIDQWGACGAPPAVLSPSSSSIVASTSTQVITTPPVVTSTITSTVTNPASTTSITSAAPITITQTISASTIKQTSTTTKWSTKCWTKTASATKCPTKATSSSKKASTTTSKKPSTKAAAETQNDHYKRAARASTKTKIVTTTCAGYTKAQRPQATHTVKATRVVTSVVWQTKQATTTSTFTHYPACTNGPKGKRDYERMFE